MQNVKLVKHFDPCEVGKLLRAKNIVIWSDWKIKLSHVNAEYHSSGCYPEYSNDPSTRMSAQVFMIRGKEKIVKTINFHTYINDEFEVGVAVLKVLTGIDWQKSMDKLDNKLHKKCIRSERRYKKIAPALWDLGYFNYIKTNYSEIVIRDSDIGSKANWFSRIINSLIINSRFNYDGI